MVRYYKGVNEIACMHEGLLESSTNLLLYSLKKDLARLRNYGRGGNGKLACRCVCIRMAGRKQEEMVAYLYF